MSVTRLKANGDKFTLYAVCNSRGDVEELRKEDGTIYARYVYDSWGNVLHIYSGTGTTEITSTANLAIQNPFRYRGYYYDTESGLYYLQSRYYDPVTGRFVSADGQISGVGGDVLGYNLYAYCQNDPVNASDSEGEWPSWAKELGDRIVHTAKIIVRIVASPIKAITAKVGIGVGLGAKAELDFRGVPIEVGVVNSVTDSIVYEKGKVDVRNTTSSAVGVNIAKTYDFSRKKSKDHSYYDNTCTCDFFSSSFGEKSKCLANQEVNANEASVGLSVGAYFLLGAEVSICVDLKAWNDELISIFYESLSYGE